MMSLAAAPIPAGGQTYDVSIIAAASGGEQLG
jgi:hypothetical protein